MDDIGRHTLFCQIRSNIRSSKQYLIVGIDIAKDKHHAFFGTARGRTLWRRLLFANDLQGFSKLREQTKKLLAQHQLEKVVFGLEPTGNYHKPLAHWLIEQKYPLVLVAGKAVKDNRQLIDGRWDKNDTKDSANVADLIGQGKCQFYEHPDHHLVALRNLLSLRKRLKKQEHGLRMQIRNGLLAKYFPEMDRHWGSCMQENLAIVRWYLDPKKIATADLDEFVCHVTERYKGIRQTQRLTAIHNTAKASIGMPVDASACFEAGILVENFNRVTEQIASTMKHIKNICQPMPGYPLLLTLPGFGPYITALALASIGNPWRFSKAKQVIRLAGLDLNANRSGKSSNDSVPKISKRGDSGLRYGLYQAALIASYHNKSFKHLFERMLENRQGERGIKSKARIKLAAKMLVIAWTMLKNNEPFDEQRLMTKTD